MVEGNPRGAEETRERLSEFIESKITVHQCHFEKFRFDRHYDLVWAEGCLPHQSDPLLVLNWISEFVKERGILCLTTANGVSYLSETLRRLFRDRYFMTSEDAVDQAKSLVSFYKPHFNKLKGMSRPIEDWILDSIVQPLEDRKLLSIPEVIKNLSQAFDVYGSSPRFITDWRWYKEIIGEDCGFNTRALNDYYQNNLNLLDYRFKFPTHSEKFGRRLENLGSRSWELMCSIENGNYDSWKKLFNLLDELIEHVESIAPDTVLAINEAKDFLMGENPEWNLEYFPQWWGRGQQYISFLRR